MRFKVANALPRVKIALAVTAVAATLQILYQPSKYALNGPLGQELAAFLLFGLLKVLGLLTLSLLFARALYVPKTLDSNRRKADIFLFAMLMGSLLLALYIFVGMRVIKSEAFVSQWGSGNAQVIACAIMAALFFVACMPFYRRQYYDMAIIIDIGVEETQNIRDNPAENSRFVRTLSKNLAIFLLPLLAVHIFILKISLNTKMPLTTSLADAFVTCLLALATGYAIATTLREMADGRQQLTSR